ncbi:hypothetical protein [Scytonema sp. HK-05]|nr:hypothetical protein [Scytonema sp. HK-05]
MKKPRNCQFFALLPLLGDFGWSTAYLELNWKLIEREKMHTRLEQLR